MKKLLVLGLVLLFGQNLIAQDVIAKKNGTEINAKIVETTDKEIKYKLFDDLDGPIYSIKKSEVVMYTINNGERPESQQVEQPVIQDTPKQMTSVNNKPTELSDYMTYKQLKTIYNFRLYEPSFADRHNPTLAGVASFFIPGLGQLICGETGRGLAFLGSHIGGAVLMLVASEYGYEYESAGATLLSAALAIGVVALDVYSIIDGIRVAKVKNMYEQDWREQQRTRELSLYPSVNYINVNHNVKPTAGLTLSMTF